MKRKIERLGPDGRLGSYGTHSSKAAARRAIGQYLRQIRKHYPNGGFEIPTEFTIEEVQNTKGTRYDVVAWKKGGE